MAGKKLSRLSSLCALAQFLRVLWIIVMPQQKMHMLDVTDPGSNSPPLHIDLG